MPSTSICLAFFPHAISGEELRAAFNPSNGWNVAAIEPDRVATRYHDNGATGLAGDNQMDLDCGVGSVSDPGQSHLTRTWQ